MKGTETAVRFVAFRCLRYKGVPLAKGTETSFSAARPQRVHVTEVSPS